MIPFGYQAHGTTSPALLRGGWPKNSMSVRRPQRLHLSAQKHLYSFAVLLRELPAERRWNLLQRAQLWPVPLGRASRAGSQTLEGVAAHQLTEIQSPYPGLRKEIEQRFNLTEVDNVAISMR